MKTIIFSLLFLLFSCGGSDFNEVEELNSFRVLAIEATNPEVAAGGNSDLRLYVADPLGGGRSINGSYEGCIDPGISFGASVSCDHDPNSVSGAYNINTSTLDPNDTFYTGYSQVLAVTVPANIHAGRSDRERFNGVAYIVIFKFLIDGKEMKSFKRIVATDRGSFNANPSGGQILINNASVGSSLVEGDSLKAVGVNPETYDFITVAGDTETRSEDIGIAWYTTDGKFSRPKTDLNESTEYKDSTKDEVLLISIIRDDRGGVQVLREALP
jgi:hypothetical protein